MCLSNSSSVNSHRRNLTWVVFLSFYYSVSQFMMLYLFLWLHKVITFCIREKIIILALESLVDIF